MNIEPIAKIETDFPTKFGIPRQSGIVAELSGRIVFEDKYRSAEAIRGLEDFSHLWVIWGFSENEGKEYSPTVRPPRLGGNKRMGVFATRSPFRPNGLGLSCLKLERIESTKKEGYVLVVSGADMVSGTPIYDIKPYLPFADSHPEATGGFADSVREDRLSVYADESLLNRIPADKREGLIGVLKGDPRPSYHHDPERIYGFPYAGFEVKFRVSDDTLTICDIKEDGHES